MISLLRNRTCPQSFPRQSVFIFSVILLCWLALAISAQDRKQPSAAPEKSPILAEVNGKEIAAEEIESALAVQLAQLEEQAYQLKRQQLDVLISERLLKQEAERRAMSLQALVDLEVTARAGTVNDKDIEAFYLANQSQIGGQLEANLKERIRSYLQNQRINARRDEYIQSLRAKAKIAVYLPLPGIRIKAGIEGAPFKGSADAPVTIIEFSDFHCPFCSKVQSTLAQVLARYGDKVKLVYRHYPIDQLHPQARRAAEAAACANEQGKFWPYHDKLYAAGADASPGKLKSLAQLAGLDLQSFDQCLSGGKHRQAIQKDIDEAMRLGINGTPAFIINGRWLSGAHPLETFVRVIEEELALSTNVSTKNLQTSQTKPSR